MRTVETQGRRGVASCCGTAHAQRSRVGGRAFVLAYLLACATPAVAQPSLRLVDINSPAGPHDGLSWQTAYKRLQNAFDDAASGDVDEIRVAGGRYTPDRGRRVQRFDRRAAFELLDEVVVLGGFAGWGAAKEA